MALDRLQRNFKQAEVAFGSAKQWLSQVLKSGTLKDASVLVIDEAHTVET